MVTVELARRLRDARLRNVLGDHLVALLHGADGWRVGPARSPELMPGRRCRCPLAQCGVTGGGTR